MITVNEYFGGKVKSLGYTSLEGRSTIGIIEAGEYKFDTSQHETMTIIEGSMDVLLPGESVSKQFKAGESFEIEAAQFFTVKCGTQTSYLCKYK
jgi:uncharacterized protein YaiE (UPF0345 family)